MPEQAARILAVGESEIGALVTSAVKGVVKELVRLPEPVPPMTLPERVLEIERRTSELEWTLMGVAGFILLILLLRGLRRD